MASVVEMPPPDDAADLKEDLLFEIYQKKAELKMLGCDMSVTIDDFLGVTRALALDVQIEKLKKQIARMTNMIARMTNMKSLYAPSNSTSALVSTLAASSVGAAQMVVMNNGSEQMMVVKRGRQPNSSPIDPIDPDWTGHTESEKKANIF